MTGNPTEPPTFALSPEGAMNDDLAKDYALMRTMIFGVASRVVLGLRGVSHGGIDGDHGRDVPNRGPAITAHVAANSLANHRTARAKLLARARPPPTRGRRPVIFKLGSIGRRDQRKARPGRASRI